MASEVESGKNHPQMSAKTMTTMTMQDQSVYRLLAALHCCSEHEPLMRNATVMGHQNHCGSRMMQAQPNAPWEEQPAFPSSLQSLPCTTRQRFHNKALAAATQPQQCRACESWRKNLVCWVGQADVMKTSARGCGLRCHQ